MAGSQNDKPRKSVVISRDDLKKVAAGATYQGSDRADYVALGNDGVTYFANGGDDYISGGKGADTIDGGSGDDRMYGNAGNDILSGGDGDDTMYGGSGNDILDGGTGDDILTGGSGSDTFVFSGDVRGGDDVITDFDVDEDSITLENVKAASYDHDSHTIFYKDQNGKSCSITLENMSGDVTEAEVLSRITATDVNGNPLSL